MTKFSVWRKACAVSWLCVATAIAAPAQTFNVLASFDGSNGANPQYISLVQGTDGNLYGATTFGGIRGAGTVFGVTSKGALTTLHNFCTQSNCSDGAFPTAGLVLATDGSFYGTTEQGGEDHCSCGTVFKLTLHGKLTILHSFDFTDGGYPYSALIQATDGSLYGTTSSGGTYQNGTIFKMTPEGILTTLHSFCAEMCPDGARVFYPLVQATDGNFYGTTSLGGANGAGTLFKMTPKGTLATLYNFCGLANCSDGGGGGGIIQARDGDFYGAAVDGGDLTCSPPEGCGTVFKVTRLGVLKVLHTFDFIDGDVPWSVVQGTDGNLFGTTLHGGANSDGTVFKITPEGTFFLLHSFAWNDGASPWGEFLLQATNGNLYGMTYFGDAYDDGIVFSLDMGLGPFVTFVHAVGKVGQTGGILGQGLTGTTSVSLNGTPVRFTVVSDTYIRATVPAGATTGYVTVTTPSGTLTSNVPFHVIK